MTKVINLDTLAPAPALAIIVDGERHEMKEATVETFLENMRDIEALGVNASPVQEVETIIRIVSRAFPTLPVEKMRKWPLSTIQQLADMARGMNAEIGTTDAKEAKEAAKTGNAPAAS
ncbi:hypothetical protein GCM10023174_10270 [Chelativorans composti]|uniref:Uncharacterized protein n=1 Tax=Chelativorans composti TaxID=768533 RepID=A0ABW5DKP3_9HYPH